MEINNINVNTVQNNIVPVQAITYKPAQTGQASSPAIDSLSAYLAGITDPAAKDKETLNQLQGIDQQLDDVQKKLDDISKMAQDEMEQNQKILDLLAALEKTLTGIQEQIDQINKANKEADAEAKAQMARSSTITLLKNQIDAQREQAKLNNDLLAQQQAPTIIV